MKKKTGACKVEASSCDVKDKDLPPLWEFLEDTLNDMTSWCEDDATRHDGNSYGTLIDLASNWLTDDVMDAGLVGSLFLCESFLLR